VKEKLNTSLVAVTVDVIDTTSVEGRRTTDDTVNLKICLDGGVEREMGIC
jgi:hypothetical protein